MAEAAPAELIDEAPSTSPLDQSLDRLMGKKKTKGSLVGYAPAEFPSPDFRPGQDTISVAGTPATGATTAESWSHDIALENLRRQALETEYTQRTAAQEFAYKQQQAALENARQQAQLGISQSAEARAAQLGGLQAQETQQAMALKQAAESRQQMEDLYKYGGVRTPADVQRMYQANADYERFRAGASISPETQRQYKAYLAASPVVNYTGVGPAYGRPSSEPVWNANAQQWMTAPQPVFTPGTQGVTNPKVNMYGQALKPSSGGWIVDRTGY